MIRKLLMNIAMLLAVFLYSTGIATAACFHNQVTTGWLVGSKVDGKHRPFSSSVRCNRILPLRAPNAHHRMVTNELASSEDDIAWLDDETDPGDNDGSDDEEAAASQPKKSSRWDNLNPKIKDSIIKKGQERAIANKKKREPAQDKKRRMMMYYKKKQQENKRASRVVRPIPFTDRTPLSVLTPGQEISGVVISLTSFGAYIDVGSECDGLLHISQMSNTFFVEHPRQILNPGDEVTVRIRSTNPEKKKLHLTMFSKEDLEKEKEDSEDDKDRIPLTEIQVDDELWGELKRVTDYGAYVEVGAEVDGFLHFMDHPSWGWNDKGRPQHPSEFMKPKDRVRVWVSDVDLQQSRIKLTSNRPPHLPGPRREL